MSAEEEVFRRIRERGSIPFAEFMDLALYWPDGGYYLGSQPVGATGDYYTSPLVHPAFGALLAVQLFQMWDFLHRPDPFYVVELGAGSGLLCRDILDYAPLISTEFRKSIQYICLDRRSGPGVERQLSDIEGIPLPTRMISDGFPFQKITGCVISNEYLDATPVHQVRLQQGELMEVYVALRDGKLVEILNAPSTTDLASRLDEVEVQLAEGQTAEINLHLREWANGVSGSLDAGFVLTVDYGHLAGELYSAGRRLRGSLTTFSQHVQTDSPLRNIGKQDITAQVDFTSVIHEGRNAGLEPLGFATQGQFLTRLGLPSFQRRLPALELSPRVLQANRVGMLALAREGGLGDFKVLAQGKNVGQTSLWGFNESPDDNIKPDSLPVPLLAERHLSLLEGRYPSQEMEFELEDLV